MGQVISINHIRLDASIPRPFWGTAAGDRWKDNSIVIKNWLIYGIPEAVAFKMENKQREIRYADALMTVLKGIRPKSPVGSPS